MPARPLHALWARRDAPPLEWFIGAGRRRARHELRGAADPPGRRRGLRARPHPAAPPRAVQRGHAGLPGPDPPGPRAGRLGPHRLRLRGRRGGRGVRAPTRPGCASSTPASPTCRVAGRGGGRRGPAAPPAAGRRALLPGRRDGRAPQGPAGPGAGLRRAWPRATRRRPGPGRAAGLGRGGAGRGHRRVAGAGRIVRTGWVAQPDLAALLARASRPGLSVALRGVRLPAAAGHAAGVPVVATRAGSLPEVLGDGALLVEPGDTTGWPRRWTPAWATRRSAAASSPPVRPGRPATRGSAVARGSRRSTATRPARPVAERAAPSVLLAVEQLRRRVPAASAPTPAASSAAWPSAPPEGDGGRGDAAGQPGAAGGADDPLAAFGRPVRHVAAAGPL